MAVSGAWSEWRLLMTESEFLRALEVGYLPHELDSLNGAPSQLLFYRGKAVTEIALKLRNSELETGKVVSIVWLETYFDSLTNNLTPSDSDLWRLDIVLPLSSKHFKLGFESVDRIQTIATFFSSSAAFNEMSPNCEFDKLLAFKISDSSSSSPSNFLITKDEAC